MNSYLMRTLERKGFTGMNIPEMQSDIYYKWTGKGYQLVLELNGNKNKELNPISVNRMVNALKNRFVGESSVPITRADVKVLSIVYGIPRADMKALCANVDNLWGIDGDHGKILMGNGEDCFDLKEPLEKMLKAERSKVNYAKQDVEGFFKKNTCYVLYALILINLLNFIDIALMGGSIDAEYAILRGADYAPYTIDQGQYWRAFTSMFLHFDYLHILNNMFVLFTAARIVEPTIGHIKFLLVYLGGGIIGNLLSLYMNYTSETYVVSAGASGCVFAIIGSILAIVLLHKGRFAGMSTKQVIFMIILSLYYGVASANVDNWAHLGGLLGGFLLTLLLYHPYLAKEGQNQYT